MHIRRAICRLAAITALAVPAQRLAAQTWHTWSFAQEGTGHQYALSPRTVTFAEAQAEAARLGGYMATVQSPAENAFLRSRFGTTNLLWRGLYRTSADGSQWQWLNREAVGFTYWTPEEPNNHRRDPADVMSGERAVQMNWRGDWTHQGRWNDIDEHGMSGFPRAHAVVERTVTPEPDAVGLMAVGIAGLGAVARCRRRRSV